MKCLNIKYIVERYPPAWFLAWKIVHSSSVFLPHDKTYNALRSLVGRNCPILLDVGANQGISALSFKKLFPNSTIISFEPNLSLAPNLANTAKRIKDFKYHMVGLGDRPGEFELFVPRYKNIYLHTFSSLDCKMVQRAIKESYSDRIANLIIIETFKCSVTTLDSYSYNPDIIKIDAEGFEDRVLMGGESTIRKSKPSIIFEAVHGPCEQICRWLSALDYDIFHYDSAGDTFHHFLEKMNMPFGGDSKNLVAVHKEAKAKLTIL